MIEWCCVSSRKRKLLCASKGRKKIKVAAISSNEPQPNIPSSDSISEHLKDLIVTAAATIVLMWKLVQLLKCAMSSAHPSWHQQIKLTNWKQKSIVALRNNKQLSFGNWVTRRDKRGETSTKGRQQKVVLVIERGRYERRNVCFKWFFLWKQQHHRDQMLT